MKRILSLGFISILGGLIAHLGIFYFIRVDVPSPRSAPADSLKVRYVGDLGIRANPALRDQAALHDSAPLFMPTRWNLVSQMEDVASLREATELFSRYPPDLTLTEPSPETFFPGMNFRTSATASLPDSPTFFLSRFGRARVEGIPDLSSAPSVLSYRLGPTVASSPVSAKLPEELNAMAPEVLWAPMQIYMHVAEGLTLGQPVVAESSGFSDWDQAVLAFVGSLDFYRTLKNGYYKVTVYP